MISRPFIAKNHFSPFMPIILTERMLQDAAEVARRLHEAFIRVLQLPEVQGRRAATLATELGVGRMTCQRIIKLRDDPGSSPNILTQVPGVAGLRRFIAALEHAGTPREQLARAESAIDAFDQFLRDLGLSQTKLVAAISLHFEATDQQRRLARRTRLFEAASSVTGQSMDATVSVMAINLSQRPEANFEQIAIRGYTQIRASLSAMPIRLPINAAFSNYRKVGGNEAARQRQVLVERFCSTPLPTIDTREIQEENLAHIINPQHIPMGEPFDCFATQHSMWNVKDPGAHKAIWLFVDYPTRSCTFDLYLHRDIAQANTITADCHLWGTSLLAPPEELWMTRFSDPLQFTVLGPGTDNCDSPIYGRHKELTQFMFANHGWNADEFVGYRCEVEMPIWRSGVCHILLQR